MSSGVDSASKPSPAPSQPRAKQNAPPSVSAKRRPDQPGGPDARLHQLLGRELLDRRQDVSARPVGPRAARGGEQRPLEILELLGVSRPATARRRFRRRGTRSAPSCNVRRRSVDCRSQSPSIAAVEPSRRESTTATPAQRDCASIRSNAVVRLIVGNRRDRRFPRSASWATRSAGGATRRRSGGSSSRPRSG